MVGKKKKQRAKAVAGSHQKCWLWGRHAVLETLRAKRWRPLEVFYSSELRNYAQEEELRQLTEELDIPLVEAGMDWLTRKCRTTEHQGLVAKMPPYPYAPLDTVLPRLNDQSFAILLAGIQDPFNFGSILRSADLFGVDAVFVPERGQAEVSLHVARSSVGAVNYLDIVQVESLSDLLPLLKQQGLRVVAATEKGTVAPQNLQRKTGVALVIGNEGAGIEESILAQCEEQVKIPQTGHVGSLNAAVAAGILCYEIRRDASGLPPG